MVGILWHLRVSDKGLAWRSWKPMVGTHCDMRVSHCKPSSVRCSNQKTCTDTLVSDAALDPWKVELDGLTAVMRVCPTNAFKIVKFEADCFSFQ
jgi:hypothetical protein